MRPRRPAVASPNVSPTPRRRATLASLADELKVSRTTISNAFNRPDQLSADLRERVLATAQRLGYLGPDPVARSLRTRKAGAGVDGFVVYSVCDDDPYLQVVLQRRLPVVVVDQPKGLSGVSRVGIDDRAGMRELA